MNQPSTLDYAFQSAHYTWRELSWDSSYFNVSSARVDFHAILNEEDKIKLLLQMNNKGFVTISNGKDYRENNKWLLDKTKAFITDVNVQFEYEVSREEAIPLKTVNIKNRVPFNQQIVEIAQNSFVFSRFMNDSYITREQAIGVYVNWVQNAFNKEDKYFCIYRTLGKICGFILFGMENDAITIELIAMSQQKNGQGIGSQLINALKQYARYIDIKKIKVGTQVENIRAINFYYCNGFVICDVRYIYHLWNRIG